MSKDILGISIGSKNTVLGTYKNGSFEVILSETSSRTIPTIISYNNNERNFGEISQNKNRANYKSTVIYPNRWLGIQNNFSIYNEESKFANIPPKKNNNLLSFNINYKGKKEFYTPECLMGLFFNKIKNIWLKQNINTKNIVISIPDYSTAQERKAMLESILISGLNCSSLLNESSAIALAYGFQKLKELDENNPRLVAFIDLGHSQTTIFFAEFTKKVVKVVSVTSERFCGARDFDYLIAEELSYGFQKRYGIDPLDSPKAKISLMNAINKCRKTLTVNKEVTISVDSLMEGNDLVYNLNRENFEKIISPILQKFENLLKASIQKALNMKVNINNLHSVEMVGDTLRTPILNTIIKNVFKKELSKTLVPDECIARGCALFAMMNSPYYKINNFSLQHYNPYLIQIEYPCINQYRQESLMYLNIFSEGENIPSTKTIILYKNQLPPKTSIQIKFLYSLNEPNLNFLPNKLLNSYNISLPLEKKTDWTLNLYYTLDNNCIPLLVKATIKEKTIEKIPITPQNTNSNINKDNRNSLNKNQNNNNINQNQKMNNNMNPNQNLYNNMNPNQNIYNNMNPNLNQYNNMNLNLNPYNKMNPNLNQYNNMNPNLNQYNNMNPNLHPYNNMNPNLHPYNNMNPNQNNNINNQQQFKEQIKEIETPTKAELLQINFGTPTDILKEYITRENNQNKEDAIIHQTIGYKNSLEQYIYDTRSKIEENGQLKGYYTDDEKKELIKKMDELLDWLYSDDKDLYNKNKLEEKSKDMKKIGDEIYKRYNEWNKLNEKYGKLESIINDTIMNVSNEETQIKSGKKANLSEQQITKIKELVKETFANIAEKKKLSDQKEFTKMPPVFPDEIDMLINTFNDNVNKIKSEKNEDRQEITKEEKDKNSK